MTGRRTIVAVSIALCAASLPGAAAEPQVTISPSQGVPGSLITVKAKDLAPNTTGTLQVGSATYEVVTKGSGGLKQRVLVPGDARGPIDVVATAGTTATTTFTALDPPPATAWPPPPRTTWNWQLNDTRGLDFNQNVQVFDIDGLDHGAEIVDLLHARNARAICYISAGSWENWRDDASSFPTEALGRPLGGWPGERWFDIRHAGIRPPLEARMDTCVQKGFDGIEFDNVDAFENKSGFPLTAEDQLGFNTWLAAEAHERGLEAALKNDLSQIPDLVDDFDFAINEQCAQFHECDAVVPFIEAGKAVFHAEYNAKPTKVCAITQPLQFSTIFKKLKLDAPMQSC